MKTFREYLTEMAIKDQFYHASTDQHTQLRIGMHIGTKDQATKRLSDVTEFNQNQGHLHKITELVKRPKSEHIEISDNGAPSLSSALYKARDEKRIPENIARIASKKSDIEKARILMKHGIHRVYYKNKYEGDGLSHIIVNPEEYQIHYVGNLK